MVAQTLEVFMTMVVVGASLVSLLLVLLLVREWVIWDLLYRPSPHIEVLLTIFAVFSVVTLWIGLALLVLV